jgi:hypothetical protein
MPISDVVVEAVMTLVLRSNDVNHDPSKSSDRSGIELPPVLSRWRFFSSPSAPRCLRTARQRRTDIVDEVLIGSVVAAGASSPTVAPDSHPHHVASGECRARFVVSWRRRCI